MLMTCEQGLLPFSACFSMTDAEVQGSGTHKSNLDRKIVSKPKLTCFSRWKLIRVNSSRKLFTASRHHPSNPFPHSYMRKKSIKARIWSRNLFKSNNNVCVGVFKFHCIAQTLPLKQWLICSGEQQTLNALRFSIHRIVTTIRNFAFIKLNENAKTFLVTRYLDRRVFAWNMLFQLNGCQVSQID